MAPYVMKGVALITGAASGIGKATTFAFADEGVTRFIIADVNEAGLQSVEKDLKASDANVQVVVVKTDTTSESDVQRMVDEGVKAFGEIHYCVNCAGVTSSPRARTHELPMEAWDRVLNINLRGVHLCQRAQITQMLKQKEDLPMRTGTPPQRGSIVNISSVLGLQGAATSGSYTAAKHGVLGLTRTDAAAYGKDGIRVNAVCPGLVWTPIMEQSLKMGSNYDALISRVPISRYAHPDEIAQVCVFLAGPRSSYVSGEDVLIDGGLMHALA